MTAGYARAARYDLIRPDAEELLVAVHGLTGSRGQVLTYTEGITRVGVLAPDLRGHGETAFAGEPDDFTPEQLAEDVEDLCDRLGLAGRAVHVLGVSLGAVVAAELAVRSHLEVRSAVFVRPAHTAEPSPAHLTGNLVVADLLEADAQTASARLLDTTEYRRIANRSPSTAANLREKAEGRRMPEQVWLLRRGTSWTAIDRLASLPRTVDALVVAAEGDPLHPVGVADAWSAAVPRSGYATVPGRDAGRDVHVRAVREQVRVFLEDRDRS